MDADAIVIGAGLSGLVACDQLIRAGRRVILLDAEPLQALGGQAHWSFGGLFLVDSPYQRRLGITDSADLAWADWLGSAAFEQPGDHWPRRWAEAFVEFAAGQQYRWLRDLGVTWFPIVQWAERGGYPVPGHGNSVPRFHVVWGTGPGVVQPFADRVLASDRVRILNRHRVRALQVEPAGNRVEGDVLAPSDVARGRPSPDRTVDSFSLTADTVIICTGGIGGNHDLVRQNWPTGWGPAPTTMLSGVPDFVDGSMLAVAEQAGARVINRDRMWHYPEGIRNHTPLWTDHGIRILSGPSALWLDARGERLPAPLFPGFDALGALQQITRAGDTHSWFVLDHETIGREFALSGSEQNADLTDRDLPRLATRLRRQPTPEVTAFIRRGADFVTGATVQELADRMNRLTAPGLISATRLQELLRARDLQVASGLGKDPQVTATATARRYPGDRLMRIARPHTYLDRSRAVSGTVGRGGPLIAVRLNLLTRKSLGGLETDLDARVLTDSGRPLPGVYAAGEAAGFGGGGMHGHRSLEGTFLGGCLFSGRAAGRAAAAQR